jgi:RHS repeat-associated protein
LGNILATISDAKIYQTNGCLAKVISGTDYYAFGAAMPSRSYQDAGYTKYRYGFNNMEKDEETGTHHFKYREDDQDAGRFWSVDPLAAQYPWNSPYAFAENRVIDGIDLEGKEWIQNTTNNFTIKVKIVNSSKLADDLLEPMIRGIILPNASKILSQHGAKITIEAKEKDAQGFKIVFTPKNKIDPNKDFYIELVETIETITGTMEMMPSLFYNKNKEVILKDIPGYVDDIGNTQINRVRIKVGDNYWSDADKTPRYTAHEIGHTGGLRHDDADVKDDKNLMHKETRGNTLTPNQVKKMIDTATQQQPKKEMKPLNKPKNTKKGG